VNLLLISVTLTFQVLLGIDSQLICTGEHPFYVVNKSDFVEAKELLTGDLLYLADGNTAEICLITIEDASEGEFFTTYNFEASDYHTYFVGNEGIWVHNQGKEACERVFSVYKWRLDKGDDTLKALQFIDQKMPNITKGTLGHTLEEIITEKFPALQNKWTKGKESSGYINQARHWLDHRKEFPTITNPITYMEEAIKFTDQTVSTNDLKIWTHTHNGVLHKFALNKSTREVAIQYAEGPLIKQIKTFEKIDPSKDIKKYANSNGFKGQF